MYANIGKKIMVLAVVIAIIMMIVSALYGVILLIKGQGVIGVITMVFGPFFSWIAGFFIYGFGRLIDNTDYIARKMGRRDGFGIPDVSDKLDWSTPEEDEAVEEPEPVAPTNFIAQRVVNDKTDVKPASANAKNSAKRSSDSKDEYNDPVLDAAIELAFECGHISTALIQRRLSVGYGRAAKIIDVMESRGIISAYNGPKPRNTLITREEYAKMSKENNG